MYPTTGDGPCLWDPTSYKCLAALPPPTISTPTFCSTCADSANIIDCSPPTVVSASATYTCQALVDVCYKKRTCISNPCYSTDNPCNCNYDGTSAGRCQFIGKMCLPVGTSPPVSALGGSTVAIDPILSRPTTCAALVPNAAGTAAVPPAPTTTSDKLAAATASPTATSDAATKLAAAITALQSSIDPVTGTPVAAQASVIILAVLSPVKNGDTYTFKVTVDFIPTDPTVVIGADILRVYCKTLQAYITAITKIELTSDCTYTPVVPPVKRDISQSMTQYDMTSTAPSSSVDATYASSASNIVVALGAAFISLFVALFM